MQQSESPDMRRARRQARQRAESIRHFMSFAGAYLAVGFFFLLINVFSGITPVWFFWPMIPMTIPLVILAWRALALSRFDDEWVSEQVEKRVTKPPTAPPAPRSKPASEIDAITAEATELIDGMRQSARHIQKPGVRTRALEVCAAADRVLSAIGDNPGELALARDFVGRYLTPASTILNDYARLASRNIAAAQPTLERVEEHDLPLLEEKLNEVHDRLHRGSLIDLQVAREMLSLDVSDWDSEEIPERRSETIDVEATERERT
jgi:hypothetical protein